MNFSWLLPETVSTFGPALDDLYYVILWITGIVFFATEITLVVFMVKYRHREGRKAEYIHGSNKAEVIWTVIPFVIVMGLAFYSKALWDEIRDPDRIPPDSFPINVMASQFEWNATYAGADGQFGTSDDFVNWTTPTLLEDGNAPTAHLYPNAVQRYERAPHMLIGFPTRFLPKQAHRRIPWAVIALLKPSPVRGKRQHDPGGAS